MRHLKYFVLFAAMATLISCSENEQPPEEEPSPVLGEWYTEDIIISGTSTETRNGQSVTTEYSGSTGTEEDSKIIFNEDNTYIREDSYTIMFRNLVNRDFTLELTVFPYILIGGTYHIEGNKIKFVSDPPYFTYGPMDPRDSFEGTITELTANRMVIHTEQQETSNVDGVEIENEYEMTQIFSR